MGIIAIIADWSSDHWWFSLLLNHNHFPAHAEPKFHGGYQTWRLAFFLPKKVAFAEPYRKMELTVFSRLFQVWITTRMTYKFRRRWRNLEKKVKRLAVSGSQTQDIFSLSRQCSATEPRQPDKHQPSQSSICTGRCATALSIEIKVYYSGNPLTGQF